MDMYVLVTCHEMSLCFNLHGAEKKKVVILINQLTSLAEFEKYPPALSGSPILTLGPYYYYS